MADKPAIEEAQRIVADEMTKGMVKLAAELLVKHGPVKAMVISRAAEPVSKLLKEQIEKLPPGIAIETCEFLGNIMQLGVSAGKGYLAMMEEIEARQ